MGTDRRIRLLFFLGGVSTAALLPYYVLYLRSRGLAPDRIGFLLAAAAAAGVVAGPAWSHVADRSLGTTRTLVVSSLANALAVLLLVPVGSDVWAIAVVALAIALTQAPGTALSDALALRVLGPDRETEYGRIRLWASVGWAGAVIAFGWWFERSGLGPMPPLYAALTLIGAAVAWGFPRFRSPPGEAVRPSRLGAAGEALRTSPRLAAFLFGVFLVSGAAAAAATFVPLRIASRGGGLFLVGLSAGVAAMIEIPFFAASTRLAARFGLRRLYVAGAGIYVVVFVGYALSAGPPAVAAFRMLFGAGFALLYASLVVVTGRLVPAHLRNTGQALMQTTSTGIGPIIGTALGGLAYAHLGASTLFLAAAGVAAVGAVVVWTALGPEEAEAAAIAPAEVPSVP
jgi:PPP family 3-phenylpropionic acid transporter